MTQAAVLRLAYLASFHRMTQDEICRSLRDARALHAPGQAITVATVERTVRIVVAARKGKAA